MSTIDRRRTLVLAAVVGGLVAVPGSAFADKPGQGCAPGFDVGEVTFEASLELPKIEQGLADGVFTVEGLEAAFERFDTNDDGTICLKTAPPAHTGQAPSITLYTYTGVDNNASVPG